MDSCPDIVRNAIDFAFEVLGQQVLYLCCYEKNVDDLENVAGKLRDARQRLQHSVDAARQKGEHIEDDVLHWMERVNVISEDIQKFREDGNHARAEFSNCRFPHLWSRYQLSRRSKELSQAIVEIQDEGNFPTISYRMAPRWWAETSSVRPSGSRIEEVLSNQMNCQKTFYVDCLPEDEAWSLFKNLAELDVCNVEHEIMTIATEVAKRCGGLPIAITTVAKTLRKKRVAQWRVAQRQLKSPTSRDIAKMADSCIEFSYRHLENHELQSLFLLSACASARRIYITDLLKYSVGLGLLGGTSTIAESRDKLETSLTTLKASCLLMLDSDSTDYWTMHDVVRDVGISIAAKHQKQLTVMLDKLNDWPDQNQLQSCTAIAYFSSY